MSTAVQTNAIHTWVPPAARCILALMVVSVAINYIDRGSLSIAAPLLVKDISMNPGQLGWLLSGFFWTYACLQVAWGWLADRRDVKWVMAIGFLIWSLATAATGLAHSFHVLLMLRLLLGVGEAAAYPCYSKILSAHFPEHQRGLANALIDAGTKFGPALGTFAGGLFMARYGWRPLFIFLGLGGLLWLPAWLKWMPGEHDTHRADARDVPGFLQILSHRSAWASITGHFCGNYFWYFLLTWLPSYLVNERHFSITKMSKVSAAAYFATAVATTVAGRLADHAIATGFTPTQVRKACATYGLAFATVVVGVVFVHNSTGATAILIIACVSYGVFASSHFAIPQTIAGPVAAGKWTGMQNGIANLAGVAAPVITGIVVGRTDRFFWAFVVSAGVVLTGALVYGFALGPVEPIAWASTSATKS